MQEPGRAVGESARRAAEAAPSGPTRPSGVDEIQVRPVSGRRELREFILLPWRIYRGVDNWVPPLISERRRHLDRRRNPFFEHTEAEYFLAWRGRPERGTPVGRSATGSTSGS